MVRGVDFRGCGFGTPGRSQAPPLRWNCEMAIKILRTLLRCIVGVGLCSTRGALRHHKALAGEQCSPLLYNRKSVGGFAPGLESFACRPATVRGGFGGCGYGTPGEHCSPLLYNRKERGCFCAGACLSLVGACMAGPLMVRGGFLGFRARHTRASSARPYYIIGKVGGVFVWGLAFCL